jgi:hypothetical protein
MPRPTSPSVAAAELDARCLDLRRSGATYRQIAGQLGISAANAHKRVTRSLDRTRREPADGLRDLELVRLDALQAAATAVLAATHHVIQAGKVVVDGQEQPYVDHGPVLAAVNTLLRVAERRARLLGLDAPAKVDATVDGTLTTVDEIDREVVRLEQELTDLDPTYAADKQRQVAAARDLAAFRTRWTRPGYRPAADPGGFVADALEVALGQLGLDPDEQEQTVAAVERLWARPR